jgi:hypothetical protein
MYKMPRFIMLKFDLMWVYGNTPCGTFDVLHIPTVLVGSTCTGGGGGGIPVWQMSLHHIACEARVSFCSSIFISFIIDYLS